MYERAYSGNIVIASEGPSEAEIVTTPYGGFFKNGAMMIRFQRKQAFIWKTLL